MTFTQTVKNEILSKKSSTKSAAATFITESFLAVGSVTIPAVSDDLTVSNVTGRYHLEFALNSEQLAERLHQYLTECNFSFKRTTRKGAYVLYTKNSSAISDFLVLVGASNAMLQLENVLVERSIRNDANRKSNCDVANINKMLDASVRQNEAIQYLADNGILATLSPQLNEIAALRLNNPDASLAELATLGNLSKSGVKHRLKKLLDIYTEEKNG
jgi:DNA-binding protein WhiA